MWVTALKQEPAGDPKQDKPAFFSWLITRFLIGSPRFPFTFFRMELGSQCIRDLGIQRIKDTLSEPLEAVDAARDIKVCTELPIDVFSEGV